MTDEKKLPAWDLSDLYKGINDPKIKSDLAQYKQLNLGLAEKYKGKMAELPAADFYEAVKTYEAASVAASKLGIFAYLNMITQMSNKEAMAFYQDTNEAMTEYGKPAIFFTLEINALPEDKFQALLQDSRVAYYAPWLKRVRMFKPYELSEDIEALLADKALTSSAAWVRLYDETASKLKYVVDGKEYNDAEISKLLQDKDPLVREKAGKELNRVNKENGELFTFIYNMIVKDGAIEDEKRGFKSPIASRNLSNRVEDEVVDTLAETVKSKYKDIAERFYKLKAKWLGKEKIQYWDRNAPLPFSDDNMYSWQESVDLVLKAYGEFSPKLQEVAKDFFTHNWIDVPPRQGKRSGAFAMPLPSDLHPYLLLNFVGKQNDVLTLAHELGHGCHMRLSIKEGDLNDDTPLTLAEVASVFAEMLTFQSILRSLKDDKAKLCLIAAKVNDMINTSLRQIAFHFFEKKIHAERKKGELSQERISEIWLEVMRESLGQYVIVDDDSKYIWPIVSHFYHSPFYVYAYSFADCLVNSLYQVYREGTVSDFPDKYLQMLSQTGVKKYDELLQPFGLDAHDPHFWLKGLSLIEEYIGELESLDEKVRSVVI
ncbi:MAG: M3 family oligoendopeptidase [Pseudomonadota bacterium]|nr:M3 family oligoendopeptidase [Pseudomonadota bacterium]